VVFPFKKTRLYCLSTSPPPNTTTSFKIPKAFTYYNMTRSSFDGDRDKAVMDFLAITEMGKFSRR
jgi:hypothetical protein